MSVIAYFSAEIGLVSELPTYSGGLGVLAGDFLRAAADAGMNIVGVTLLYRKGYGRQHLDENGIQTESYPEYDPSTILQETKIEIALPLDGATVYCRAWKARISGVRGHEVEILFLDTLHPNNSAEHSNLVGKLYGGDDSTRIRQEYVLGVGGVRLLKTLGYWPLKGIHLNEGHCAFAALEMLKQGWNLEELRKKCLFTTHTPVPAGFDRFEWCDAEKVLGDLLPDEARDLAGRDKLSMSSLAVSLSGRVNAVSRLNAEVAAGIFPGKRIVPITNGVHHTTWTCPSMAELYDLHLEGWREDSMQLTCADNIPDGELLSARREARFALRELTRSLTGIKLDPDTLTIGFARRFVLYKRADLVFRDLDRFVSICAGKAQFVFAGKAHPKDKSGKALIESIFSTAKVLEGKVKVAFLPDYSMATGLAITSGVDVWLNNPVRTMEASGTSGMKASMNGVPNCSILDGWWPEAYEHGVNGWAFGNRVKERDDVKDANALYSTLEREVLPAWSEGPLRWSGIMRAAIITSARFTAARMLSEYERIYKSFGKPD